MNIKVIYFKIQCKSENYNNESIPYNVRDYLNIFILIFYYYYFLLWQLNNFKTS